MPFPFDAPCLPSADGRFVLFTSFPTEFIGEEKWKKKRSCPSCCGT